ncbi:hypothetical protein, variant 1 [Allomyces macrogynus ATCC 38327]|uniref:Cyclic nucleotide-binding domain-containing protein n=1 Tax=Allomyces macrogynus (strain ATCC 38327) TaxID=578462 RepID=A0A0L0S9U3_ALLM3|nr:hypothetical protein, variant 1 [Allomyces macrogynus ATCC 38327]|eukprot:KNE59368.1 hypothetical protein, variant 1 [Allomyces macrogynus ATCC 38327]
MALPPPKSARQRRESTAPGLGHEPVHALARRADSPSSDQRNQASSRAISRKPSLFVQDIQRFSNSSSGPDPAMNGQTDTARPARRRSSAMGLSAAASHGPSFRGGMPTSFAPSFLLTSLVDAAARARTSLPDNMANWRRAARRACILARIYLPPASRASAHAAASPPAATRHQGADFSLSEFAAHRAAYAMSADVQRVLALVPPGARSEADVRVVHAFVDAFQGLRRGHPRSLMREICQWVECRTWEPGRVLVKHGHTATAFFCLVSGHCNQYRAPNPGDTDLAINSAPSTTRVPAAGPAVARVLGPGDVFGDVEGMHGHPRRTTVITTSPCRMLVIRTCDWQRAVAMHEHGERETKLAFLAPTALALPAAELAAWTSVGTVREYARGDVIVAEGDPVAAVRFVRRGTVHVVKWIELWHERVDDAPPPHVVGSSLTRCGGTATAAKLRNHDALTPPRFMVHHHRPGAAVPAGTRAVDKARGDRVDGKFLTVAYLGPGEFFEEQCVLVGTPTGTSPPPTIAADSSPRRRSSAAAAAHSPPPVSASRHVVDARAVFYATATYVASDDQCEIVEFANSAFLKVASDRSLHTMDTLAKLRTPTDQVVHAYLQQRAYGIVKRKVVEDVVQHKRDRQRLGEGGWVLGR